ncbi:MAG: dinitrogenase iron-molybdenum cofactor biosynthesis protein [Clostridium sp.]|jgi:predicted Fe-Mo cluster-binding NifX family protein|nr:dinitrogenase iron-molybdenum cofactor biosynthesis protein [Clostridium sp.]
MDSIKIAVATSDGKSIDLHFGHAEWLRVYTVDAAGGVEREEERPGLASRVCKEDDSGGFGEDAMRGILASLSDCKYVLVKRIGPHMVRELAAHGITSFELFGELDAAIVKIAAYERKQRERKQRNETQS